jgi:hypothetical protein
MMLNSRVTWGLAWAGLALVVAVPSADMVAAQFSSRQAMVVDEVPAKQKPAVEQVALIAPIPANRPANRDQVAAAKPAAPVVTTAAAGNDIVDRFVSTGKKLPSYISGGDTAAVETPAPTKPVVQQPATQVAVANPDKPVTWGESKWATPGGKDPLATAATKPAVTTPAPQETVTDVAVLSPQPELIAPIPMPASMRPKSRAVAVTQPNPGIDPQTVASFNNTDRVTARDLQDWESGPLSDFLAQRQAGKRMAQQPQRRQQFDPRADGDYVEYNAGGTEYLGPVNTGPLFFWN